jgi:hypothetical protein
MDARSFKPNNDWEDAKNIDIWEDHISMSMLENNQLPKECGDAEKPRVSKCILHYY